MPPCACIEWRQVQERRQVQEWRQVIESRGQACPLHSGSVPLQGRLYLVKPWRWHVVQTSPLH